MIAYYTKMSLKKCTTAPCVGYHGTKVKDDDECSNDESIKKGPLAKVLWYLPIIPRFKHLLLVQMTQKTLHGMQMGKIMTKCSTI